MGEHRHPPALAAQDVAPELVRAGGEGVGRLRRNDEPRVVGELGLQLSRAPARVPDEHAQRVDAEVEVVGIAADVDTAHVVEDRHPPRARVASAARERDHRFGGDRAAAEHDAGRGRVAVPLREHRGERGFGRAVEDDAQRALVAVLEHQHDAAVEVGIDEGRRRDQQPAPQRLRVGGHGPILAPPYAPWVPGSPSLLDALRAAVGPAHVLTDPDVTAGQVRDWTGRFTGTTPAVVRPGSVDEVAAVLRICGDAGAAVVPQGGNTGLVGGSVPLHGEVLLDLRRFDALYPVEARAGQVTAEAGVTIARLHDHARGAGWDYGVDLSARDSATVGGTVATNAGGMYVMRYGATRRQVLGIEAVLSDGRVVRHLDGLEKDNTGYDLPGLLCGSEGTLAVITAARLRLVPRLTHVVVALLAFDDIECALDGVGGLRRAVDSLRAVELFFQDGLDLVCDRLGLPRPFARPHHAFVLVEAAAGTDPTGELADAIEALAGLADSAVAADDRAARDLWRYREGHTESINQLGAPHKLDVTLPGDQLTAFVEEVRDQVVVLAPHATVWLFGHAADGNIHVNVTGVAPDDEGITDTVLRLVARRHGSISAEHGIGTAKRAWLSLVRSAAEIDAFRAIKSALDPARVLNPHVLLPRDDDN